MQADSPTAAEPLPPPSPYIQRGTASYWRAAGALVLAGYSTFSLMYCVQPLLPLLARDFDLSPTQSSLALSVTTGLLALSIFAAGAVSEMAGRKALMAASLCSAAILNVLAALAPTWPLMLLARGLEGIALGGAPAVAMAYLAEEIEPRSLGFAMGLYIGGTALGGMTGRVLTGIAADLGGWRTALAMIGALGLASASGFAALLPPSRNFVRRPGLNAAYHLRAWGGHLSAKGLPWLFAIGFLAMGGFVAVYNYAGFLLTGPTYGLSQAEAGGIFLVYLFGMVASSLAGAAGDRFGRAPVLAAGLMIFAAGLALTLAHSLVALISGIALATIGFFVAHGIASGWVGRMATGAKGHAASLYLLAYYLGSSLLGSAGGWFWTQAGWGGVVGFVAVLLVAALAVAGRLARLREVTAPDRLAASGSR
jgi:YNFM family putative membrane transporter